MDRPVQLQALFEESLGKLRNAYMRARDNPMIHALTPVMALYDLRMDELTKRLEQGDTTDFRYQLKTLYESYNDGVARGDDRKADLAFRDLGKLIKDGAEYDSSWEKLLEKADRRSDRAERAIELGLKREKLLTEREYQERLGKILDILIEELESDQAKVVVARIGREAMEDGAGDPLLEIGGGEGRGLLALPEQAPRIFQGGGGVEPVGEAGGDHAGSPGKKARRGRKL